MLVYTITLDKLLAVGASRTKLEIVSRHNDEIREAILEDLDRSVTMLHGRTGYVGEETDVIFCVKKIPIIHQCIAVLLRKMGFELYLLKTVIATVDHSDR